MSVIKFCFRSKEMSWPFLILSFIAFLTTQGSSYPEYPSFSYQETTANDDEIPEPEETFGNVSITNIIFYITG